MKSILLATFITIASGCSFCNKPQTLKVITLYPETGMISNSIFDKCQKLDEPSTFFTDISKDKVERKELLSYISYLYGRGIECFYTVEEIKEIQKKYIDINKVYNERVQK